MIICPVLHAYMRMYNVGRKGRKEGRKNHARHAPSDNKKVVLPLGLVSVVQCTVTNAHRYILTLASTLSYECAYIPYAISLSQRSNNIIHVYNYT